MGIITSITPMTSSPTGSFPADCELVLNRVINAAHEKLWRCWTEPELIVQRFTPAPWKTVEPEVDLRSGGSSCITMQSPEGQAFPNRGVYRRLCPTRRLSSPMRL